MTAAPRSAFGQGGQLDRLRRIGRYDVAFRLQENHWNGTVAPQLVVKRVFDEDERWRTLRARLVAQWKGEAPRTPEAEAIFAELELEPGAAAKRSLLESATFRALLAQEEPPLAHAA